MTDEPLLGVGLTRAADLALTEAGVGMHDIDFRLSDVTGESYGFKEQVLAVNKLLKVHKEEFPLWHYADAIGDTGAAAGLCQLAIAYQAFVKGYAPGRRAVVLHQQHRWVPRRRSHRGKRPGPGDLIQGRIEGGSAMGCDVFANDNEVACKASGNKVIAAMPDVCMSPPSPPAGPVPVPYPDSSFAKDMQNGSKTVLIKGQEVMLKDQSFYKTSPLGDEAATNSFGANLVSHVITGRRFAAWSMDVQVEGQNVDRHLDMTTSNNASPGTTVGPFPSLAEMRKAKKAAGLQKRAKKRLN